MKYLATYLVSGLLLLAVNPAIAQARVIDHHHKTHVTHVHRAPVAPPNPLLLAEKRASQYWGSTPCEGHVTVQYGEPTQSMIEGWHQYTGNPEFIASAWSSWNTPAGENEKAPESNTFTNCTVTLRAAAWQYINGVYDPEKALEVNYESLCTTLTHEYGNLFGFKELIHQYGNNIMDTTNPSTPTLCQNGPYEIVVSGTSIEIRLRESSRK